MKSRKKAAAVAALCLSLLTIPVMAVHLFCKYQFYLQHPEYSAPFSVYVMGWIAGYGIVLLAEAILSIVLWKKA